MHKATKEKIPEVKLQFLYQTGKHKINKRSLLVRIYIDTYIHTYIKKEIIVYIFRITAIKWH